MNGTIMGRFQCSSYLNRANILILFILTLYCVIQQLNALNDTATTTTTTIITTPQQQFVHSKKMSAFNNYNHMKSSSRSSSDGSGDNNNNRFSSIRNILYHRPNHWYVNETLRWHKINMISNLFKHRVKRKVKQLVLSKSNINNNNNNSSSNSNNRKPLQSSVSISTSNAIIYGQNISTNSIDFSNNQQIHEILTLVHLNMLLNQRSIHNATDILALNFSHNLIKQIDASLLHSLVHVRRLDLSHNKIEMFNVKSVSGSSNSHQIEWLSISNNGLQSFNGENLKHLKYLDLSCNNIENASQIRINTNSNSSSGGSINDFSELEYVNLSGNRLNQLQVAHVVEKLFKLKVMNLAYNRMGSIQNAMFRNLVDIEALDLSHNRIELVESVSFSSLLKLQYLDLSHNLIGAISLRAFLPIPNMRKLSIAFNTRLGNALQGFISSWSLKNLDMSGTGLCEIPNALTQSVRTLNISNNNFGVIRCGDLDSYPLLQHVDISSCHIFDIEEDALGRLDMLVTLHLNNNNIAHVPSSLPVNLVRLFLQNNRITEIQSSTFSHLVHLEVVDLSRNRLTYIPSLPLPQLMVLDLRATGLRRLSSSIIKMSPRLRIVYLDGNPIKCNELLGVAEWATPCRTDDFTEIGNMGIGSASDASDMATAHTPMSKRTDRMESSQIWPTCDCNACQSVSFAIDQIKLHCNNKNVTNSKRIRLMEMPLSTDGVLINGNPLINDTLLLHITSINENDSMENHNPSEQQHIHRNHNETNNETVANGQQLKQMNGFRLHNNSTAYSITVQQKNASTVDAITQSSDNLNETNPMMVESRGTKPPQSLGIITNDISTATAAIVNRPAYIERYPVRMGETNSSSKIDAQSPASQSSVMSVHSTTAVSPLNRNKDTKTSEVTLENALEEKLINKPTENSSKIISNGEVLHLNQIRIRFDYHTSAGNVGKQRNHIEIDTHHAPTNEMPISANKLESLITMEFTTPTTKMPNKAIDDNSKRNNNNNKNNNNNWINFQMKSQQQQQRLEPNASEHKVNKSQANWNINKAISTTNDNLQRDRNLVPTIIDEEDDNDDNDDDNNKNLLDNSSSSHINEINKKQLAAGNQLNEIRTSDIDVNSLLLVGARGNSVKESDDQQTMRTSPATIKKTKKIMLSPNNGVKNKLNNNNSSSSNGSNIRSNITIDKGLNKRIINLNSSTETDGMVINDGMKNGQQIGAINEYVSHAPGKISIAENGQLLAAVSVIDAHKESVNIGLARNTTESSISSDSNQILSNDTVTMTKTSTSNSNSSSSGSSNDERAMTDKGSSFEIDAKDKVVDNDNDGNQQKDEQMQQIKSMATTTTTTVVDRTSSEASEKENPLIGHISENVSIIDNEHQFQRHINIDHSMHGQKTFESGTNTKLKSANDDHVRIHTTQDGHHNSDGGNNVDNDGSRSGSDDVSDNSAKHGVSEQWNDKRVTSGHSGLFVVIGIGIGVFVTLNFLHIYRLHKRRQYNQQRSNAATERNRQAENLLIGMQMEMLNSTHYTDTPIDLW